ncbi:serine/threonine-protein kinase [Nocardioides sediminis]|uniref:serine/threonine-protein kinase n=1 Tax=Nocardioides sediminis TaxID=433648 RepID=UPI0018FFA4DD|nr:serine/threonine-protein kinase [Nocardioides sediminis]
MSTPSLLGRYPVRRRLGAGAFATVWLAHDDQLDSPVAIKVLADNWTEDLHVRQRFLEEGRFLRRVESPHVVSVYDAGELPDGRPFLVMSYADQGTLADRLELAPLTRAQAVHVVAQAGAGLHALHQRGVLHRDIKPANVLFRTVELDGHSRVTAMVGDLGLGKAMDMSSRLTMIGGTPQFVAPEQARGEALDARADQFSLAAVTYLLLAGRAPYDHTSLIAAAEPAPAPPMGGGLPDAVEAAVHRGLAVDREDRFPDVPAFVAALTAALDETFDGADEPPTAWIPTDPSLTRVAGLPVPSGEAPAGVGSSASGPDTTGGTSGTAGPASAAAKMPMTSTARRRWALVGVAALVIGLGGGFALERTGTVEQRLVDANGTISVTVPADWTAAVDDGGWTPPYSSREYAAISAGTAEDWNGDEEPGHGVFVGLMRGYDLPTTLPQHPECEETRPTSRGVREQSMTVVSTGCSDDGVTVERVVQATADQLLWVQVRSADQGTANKVLDSVELYGLL